MKKLLLCAIAVVTASVSVPALADRAVLATNITRTVTDNDNFGNCLAQISTSVRAQLPQCSDGWVSFSCSGDFNKQEVAQSMFDTATAALLLSRRVNITVESNERHNGYCVVKRIDLR